MDNLGRKKRSPWKKIQKKLAKTKILRGSKANRLALIAFGPLAPVVKTIRDSALGKKKSLAAGKIRVPKILKKIPVIRNMPGVKSGAISFKSLASISAILPAKAIKRELKERRKKKAKPVQIAAEAISEGAAVVAEEQGIAPSQVVEQPMNDDQVQQNASSYLREEVAYLREQLEANKKEQAIRRAEIEQMSSESPEYPEVDEARTRDEIISDQSRIAVSAIKKYPAVGARYDARSEESVNEISDAVGDQWLEAEQDELDNAEIEGDILQDSIGSAEEALEMVESDDAEWGFQGLMGLLRDK